MPLFNEIRSNVGLISLLSIILLLNISCDMQTPRKQNYGLNSSDDHFLYSYFLTNSELFVKTRSDFDKQFDTKEYKELQNQVETIYESSGRYIQAEPIYLPVVQKIIQGNKFVFIFETKEETMDGTLVKRIAFECKELKASIKFPDECVGYYMRDGWEWPPDIFQIVSGEVKLKDKSLVTGYLAGNLSLFFMDDVYQNKQINISGGFIIYDRNKSLFFSKPAHF
jgi:hypothetical protein